MLNYREKNGNTDKEGSRKARYIFMKDAVKYIDFGRDIYEG